MKENRLSIRIERPAEDVFAFTITPPNSTLWIPSTISEETNEWPIQVGTHYVLTDSKGDKSTVVVSDLEPSKMVLWSSEDGMYHCKYTYRKIGDRITELQYHEWVDRGHLSNPFSRDVLVILKQVLEA